MILNLNTKPIDTQIKFKRERIDHLRNTIRAAEDQIYILECEVAELRLMK